MALDNHVQGNFITILGGKFCKRVKDGETGGVTRTNKLGKTVTEKFYDSFTGKLVGIKTQDGTYGKSWIFSFQDSGDVYHLQLSYTNSFAKGILRMLPNVDLTKEMKVQPEVKMVDGKNKSSIFINQGGVSIKHAYTKDNPNGLPQMVQITVKGEKVWDDTEQLEFLYQMVMDKIVPKLTGFAGATTSHEDDEMAVSTDTPVGKGMDLDEEPPF